MLDQKGEVVVVYPDELVFKHNVDQYFLKKRFEALINVVILDINPHAYFKPESF